MLSFANPEFLWLTPLALAFSLWWALRRRPTLRYSRFTLLDGLPRGRAGRVKWFGAILRGLALLVLLIACAGPRRPDERTRIPTEGIAIMMTLDVSGSMAEVDVPWPGESGPISRLDAAKRSFRLFVAGGDAPDGSRFRARSSDLVGLVTFAVVPQTPCPLTLNHTVLLRILDEQKPLEGLHAGTNIGDAIAEAVLRLEAAGNRPKVMILLSDGEHNVFRDGENAPWMPRQAAQFAYQYGITVYTIDAGGDPKPTATPEEREQRLKGREILKTIASMTGGRAFAATSGTELLEAYREIDELEKKPVVSFVYRRYFEYYPWFAGVAVALILLTHILDRTRWRRLP